MEIMRTELVGFCSLKMAEGPRKFGGSVNSIVYLPDSKSETELCRRSQQQEGEERSKGKGKETNGPLRGVKRYGGMILTLVASVSFTLAMIAVKLLKDFGYDAYGSSFWRHVGIAGPAIPILLFYQCKPYVKRNKGENNNLEIQSVFNTVWPLWENKNWKTAIGVLVVGLVGSSSVILRYYALRYLSVADTLVITKSTPILVTFMAHFCLGERCGVFPVVIAFTTLAGVVIVAKPPLLTGEEAFDHDTLIGTGLACGSLLCSALLIIVTRKIRKVHFSLMILAVGATGILQAVIMAFTTGDGKINLPVGLTDSLLTLGLAGACFTGQMSMTMALKFEDAGPVALIRSCDVVFGFLLQYLFLGVSPDKYSFIGGVIVLLGVLGMGCRKWVKTLPEEDSVRKKCSCILK